MTGGGNLDRTIIQKGEKAATALAEIFGAKGESSSILEERNNNHFAAIIAYLFEEAGKAQGEEDVSERGNSRVDFWLKRKSTKKNIKRKGFLIIRPTVFPKDV